MYGRQMEINCFRWTKGNAKEIVRKRLRKCGGSGKDLKGCLRGPKRNAKEINLKESQRISKIILIRDDFAVLPIAGLWRLYVNWPRTEPGSSQNQTRIPQTAPPGLSSIVVGL